MDGEGPTSSTSASSDGGAAAGEAEVERAAGHRGRKLDWHNNGGRSLRMVDQRMKNDELF